MFSDLNISLVGLIIPVILAITTAIFSVPIYCMVNKAGSAPVNLLYGTGKKELNLREQMTGDLDKARFYKRKEEFDQALRIVNNVIEQDPEFPEALFLKAHIVWEGFENLGMARDCLKKIIEMTSNDDKYYKWAASFWDELHCLDK